ncbi:unnamed protein product [Lactuca saligna]|uniref:Uncharacterized protein n=1 Tax=Lactuca saligna TaxID=75948 RepID=A0AA36ELN9_LACSI|nr:unnamed protein product [Lactuca saligna]
MSTPIITVALHQDDQEASSSNFQNFVRSQLSLIVQLTQIMDKRLTKFERYVATIKRLMVLCDDDDDDDMVLMKPLLALQISVANILDVDATTDQPIPYTGDQSKIDDYEGFLDLGFMQEVVVPIVPLNVVYPGSSFKGDIS